MLIKGMITSGPFGDHDFLPENVIEDLACRHNLPIIKTDDGRIAVEISFESPVTPDILKIVHGMTIASILTLSYDEMVAKQIGEIKEKQGNLIDNLHQARYWDDPKITAAITACIQAYEKLIELANGK